MNPSFIKHNSPLRRNRDVSATAKMLRTNFGATTIIFHLTKTVVSIQFLLELISRIQLALDN